MCVFGVAVQGRVNFPVQRAIVRSRLAREAIMKKAYVPPMAPAAAPSLQQLFQQQEQEVPSGPQQHYSQQQQQAPRRQGSGQQNLFSFGFTSQPRPVSTGPEDMDM